jgi:putative ABC transport system permease protein
MILTRMKPRLLRNSLTVAAVAISVTMLLTMLSFAEGLQARIVRELDESREDIIITTEGFAGVADGHEVTQDVLATDGVSDASPFLGIPLLCSPNTTKVGRPILSMGIVPELSRPFLNSDRALIIDEFRLEFKDWFREEGDPHYNDGSFDGPVTGEVLVDQAVKKRFDLDRGDPLHFTTIGGAASWEFRITGFFEDSFTGEGLATDIVIGAAVMHLSELQSLRSGWDVDQLAVTEGTDLTSAGGANATGRVNTTDDSVTGLSVMVDRAGGQKAIDRVTEQLKEDYPYYMVNSKEDRVALRQERVAWTEIIYTVTGSVSLIIGLLFVVTIMVMSVYERTAELGMMRAIGISRRTIFLQILGQSLLLMGIGSTVGAVLGYFTTLFFSSYVGSIFGVTHELAVYTPGMVLSNVALVMLMGALFSLYPSWRAMRVDVVRVLKHAG